MRAGPIRVALADDEDLFLEAIAELIRSEPTMELVGTACDAPSAIRLASETDPDVMLLDLRMPGGGIAATRQIRQRHPMIRVVALSAYGDRGTVLEMVRAGAAGYVAKGSPAADILTAVRRAARGQGALSAEVSTTVLGELAQRLDEQDRVEEHLRKKERRIRAVLEDPDAMRIALQPILDLSAQRQVGSEALARFAPEPVRRPDVWFAEASEVGLRLELELAAVRAATACLSLVPDDRYLAINVSPSTVRSPGFNLLFSGVPPGRIVLEVTEHAPVDDYESLAAALAAFRGAGGRLAVDDAGAGFASLRHILRLDPDFIKLDGTLTQGIDGHPGQRALANALISFASEIGASIIAEGIETEADLAALRALGVPFGQGYLLGRPVTS